VHRKINEGKMSLIENIVSAVRTREPKGKVQVVDHSPFNWLYITYNTVEELIRTDEKGHITPAAMKNFRWIDDLTLEIEIRTDAVFPNGEKLDSTSVKRGFDEMMKWRSPHPNVLGRNERIFFSSASLYVFNPRFPFLIFLILRCSKIWSFS
jgi:ABC-type transport system substrate-binding protein